jgi:hypothetical protein
MITAMFALAVGFTIYVDEEGVMCVCGGPQKSKILYNISLNTQQQWKKNGT